MALFERKNLQLEQIKHVLAENFASWDGEIETLESAIESAIDDQVEGMEAEITAEIEATYQTSVQALKANAQLLHAEIETLKDEHAKALADLQASLDAQVSERARQMLADSGHSAPVENVAQDDHSAEAPKPQLHGRALFRACVEQELSKLNK